MKTKLIFDKQTDYVIIIPKNPAPVEQTAAEELQQYVGKVLGVMLPIKKEDESMGAGIYIGQTEYAKVAGILGNAKENWIIKMHNGNLVLTGGVERNDRGTLYSVYHFLEDIIDVRWWSYWEEDVPSLEELSLEDDFYKEGTPAFYYRKSIHYGAFKDFYFDARTRTNVVSGDDGLPDGVYHPSIKKLGGAMPMGRPHHVHTLEKYFPAEEYFEAHPDWFAWSAFQGKRVSDGHYCFTNEEFFNALLEKLLAYIEEDQRLAKETGAVPPCFYDISFPDIFEGFCQCEACQAILEKSGPSGYALYFINKIARAVAEKYPDVKIETLAYAVYLDPPKDDTLPEKNVIIRLAQIYVDIIHDIHNKGNAWYLSLLKSWSEICKKAGCDLYIWEYMYHILFDIPAPIANRLGDTFRTFADYGVTGVFVENECLSADMWELTHYMLTHLSEDPYADADALIRDFMNRFYGPAAPYVQEYYDELCRASLDNNYSVFCVIGGVHFNYLDAKTVTKGLELLQKAMDAVRGDSVFEARVQYVQTLLMATAVIKFYDLKKMAEREGVAFDYDREALRQMVIAGLEDSKKLPRIGTENGRIRSEIQYFQQLDIEENNAAIPEELCGVNPENVYQFHFKDSSHYIYTYSGRNPFGFSVTEDPDAATGKTIKFSRDASTSTVPRVELLNTSRYAEHSRPISITIEQDAKILHDAALYLEDIVPDEYHLYKIGSVSGIRDSADTRVTLFGRMFEWISLTGISVVFPMDSCDIYLSMKFTGERYGGKPGEQEAVYLDRAVIVRR